MNNVGGLCSNNGILGQNEFLIKFDVFFSPAKQFLVESAHAVKVAAEETSETKAKMPPIAVLLGDVICVGFCCVGVSVQAENDGKVNLFPESGMAATSSEEFGTNGNVNVTNKNKRLWRQEADSDFKSEAAGKTFPDTIFPNLFNAKFLPRPGCTILF